MTSSRSAWKSELRAHRTEVEERILKATAELLGSRRIESLTIEDVMESTGLSRTAFYRYFPSIDRVIALLLADIVLEVDEGADWQAADPDADFYGIFELQGTSLAAIYARHGAIIAALSDATEANPEIYALWNDTIERRIQLVADRLRVFQANGLARDYDVDLVAGAVTLMAHHLLIRTYRHRSDVAPEAFGRMFADLWFRMTFDAAPPSRPPATQGEPAALPG